jgi:hypothetical protein
MVLIGDKKMNYVDIVLEEFDDHWDDDFKESFEADTAPWMDRYAIKDFIKYKIQESIRLYDNKLGFTSVPMEGLVTTEKARKESLSWFGI